MLLLILSQHTYGLQEINAHVFFSMLLDRWKFFSTCANFLRALGWTTSISLTELQWVFLRFKYNNLQTITLISHTLFLYLFIYHHLSLSFPELSLILPQLTFFSLFFHFIYEAKKPFAMVFFIKICRHTMQVVLHVWEILAGKEEKSLFLLCAASVMWINKAFQFPS